MFFFEVVKSFDYLWRKRHTIFILNIGSCKHLPIWALMRENLSSGVCEQEKWRPACASTQSDQHPCYLLNGKYHIKTCYKQNFTILASLLSWVGWFWYDLVRQIFYITAHIWTCALDSCTNPSACSEGSGKSAQMCTRQSLRCSLMKYGYEWRLRSNFRLLALLGVSMGVY